MTKSIINPAIVVIAYNREKSLSRLLGSLSKSNIPKGTTLIISIDNGNNPLVAKVAREFNYAPGEKIIIEHKERLGLRKHVLSCGDFTKEYGSIIMLEDDIYVSPYFYQYTQQAQEFYRNSEKIGGISLYAYPVNPTWELPFSPLIDGSDVFFAQRACSWGQSWTWEQWEPFRTWYDENNETVSLNNLPALIISWPENSWLKYFIKYLVEFDKYFVYPRAGFTTCFTDLGTHSKKEKKDYQANLQFGVEAFKFRKIEDSYCLYDVYYELNTDKLKQLNPFFKGYDFCMDLYGIRSLAKIENEYLLTTKKIKNPIKTYSRSLKPHEMNVILYNSGKEIYFGKKEDVYTSKSEKLTRFISNFEYFYRRELSRANIKDYILYKFLKLIGIIKR